MCVCVCLCGCVKYKGYKMQYSEIHLCFHCSPMVRFINLQEKQCRHKVYTVYIPGIPDIPSGRPNDI